MIILEAPNAHFANVILLLLMLLMENQLQIRTTIQPNVCQIIAAVMENVANRQQDYIFCLIHKNISAVAVLLYHLDHANLTFLRFTNQCRKGEFPSTDYTDFLKY